MWRSHTKVVAPGNVCQQTTKQHEQINLYYFIISFSVSYTSLAFKRCDIHVHFNENIMETIDSNNHSPLCVCFADDFLPPGGWYIQLSEFFKENIFAFFMKKLLNQVFRSNIDAIFVFYCAILFFGKIPPFHGIDAYINSIFRDQGTKWETKGVFWKYLSNEIRKLYK